MYRVFQPFRASGVRDENLSRRNAMRLVFGQKEALRHMGRASVEAARQTVLFRTHLGSSPDRVDYFPDRAFPGIFSLMMASIRFAANWNQTDGSYGEGVQLFCSDTPL